MFINFIKNFNEAKPTIKATKHPIIKGKIPTVDVTSPKSFASRMKAPNIAGIERINENSPDVFLSMPAIWEAEIVIPEREIPGSVPIPWAIPIKNPFRGETVFTTPSFSTCLLFRIED